MTKFLYNKPNNQSFVMDCQFIDQSCADQCKSFMIVTRHLQLQFVYKSTIKNFPVGYDPIKHVPFTQQSGCEFWWSVSVY